MGGGASWLKRPRTQTQAAAGEAPGARGDAQGGSGGEGEKGVANGGVEGGRRCEQDAHVASCRGGGAAVWAVYLRERTFGGGQLCGQPCATRWGGHVQDAHVAMRSRAGGTRWVWTAAGRWGGMSGCRRMSGWPHLTATASRCRSQ